jgi:hypothetical protein
MWRGFRRRPVKDLGAEAVLQQGDRDLVGGANGRGCDFLGDIPSARRCPASSPTRPRACYTPHGHSHNALSLKPMRTHLALESASVGTPNESLCLQLRQRPIPRSSRRRSPEAPARSRESPQGQRRKTCSRRESPPIPAQPGSAMTGLSRRRSRVRVPSLPSQTTCKSAYYVDRLDTAPAHASHTRMRGPTRNARKRATSASAGDAFKPFAPCVETDGKMRPATKQKGRRSRPSSRDSRARVYKTSDRRTSAVVDRPGRQPCRQGSMNLRCGNGLRAG